MSGTISGGSDKKGLLEGAFASLKAYDIVKYDNWLVVQLLKEGGTLKRIILSATLVATTAAMIAVNTFSVTAQEDGGQYASDVQSAPTTVAAPSGEICAPWSKAYDLQKGQWVYQWYRWCVDPSSSDPSVESSWHMQEGETVQEEQANLCPEKGTCTLSPEGGMRMSTSTDPADKQAPTTPTTTSPSTTTPTTPTNTTNPVDTQTPTTTDPVGTQPPPTPTTTSPSTTPTTTNTVDMQTPTSVP